MPFVYSKMGRKRKVVTSECGAHAAEEEDPAVSSVAQMADSPVTVYATWENTTLPKVESGPVVTATEVFVGVATGNYEEKVSPPRAQFVPIIQSRENYIPESLEMATVPEAVDMKVAMTEEVPEGIEWKQSSVIEGASHPTEWKGVEAVETLSNEEEWKHVGVVEVGSDECNWKETVMVEPVTEVAEWRDSGMIEGHVNETDWKESGMVGTENDSGGMVDLSEVVDGIPLVGDEVGLRKDYSMQMEDDGMGEGYYSPPKETFVLTITDTQSPLIDDLVVVHDHDTTPLASILVDQEEPRDSIARGSLDRTALRCHEHTLKLEEWKLTRKQKELVCRAGFGNFIKIGSFTLDKQHITALVERWNKETNTFHLPVGEMTITLDEVAINLGLAIDGDPVVAVSGKDESVGSMCLKYLGKAPSLSDKKGGFLKLGWLKDSFSTCSEDSSLEKVEKHTRAYLLYLVGSTIFSTTTGNTVPVLYLPLFEDFDRAGKYAWGAAALAFLYRSLSNASSRAQNTISGCLTLLQCWSYLHLDIRRPRLSEKANLDVFPLALRWKQKQSGHRTKWSVLQYQRALDSLQLYDVEWLPYKNLNDILPDDMKGSLILGKSKTTLLCLDKAEKHNPDRCLRQFGMPQPIPETVMLMKEMDGETRQTESKDLSHGEWLERRERIVEEDFGVDDEEYAEWYSKFNRNVRRKTSLEDVYQQTVIGLTKMLELAETLSRDEMPTKNKDVVRNITNTLSESLKEVVSVMASQQRGI